MKKLEVGDRVKVGETGPVFEVIEVDPPNAAPAKPSTYCVLINPESGGGPAQIYGNHRLIPVD